MGVDSCHDTQSFNVAKGFGFVVLLCGVLGPGPRGCLQAHSTSDRVWVVPQKLGSYSCTPKS